MKSDGSTQQQVEKEVLQCLCITRQEISAALLSHIAQRCVDEQEKHVEDVIQEMEDEGWFSWWKGGEELPYHVEGAILGYSSEVE